MSLRIKNVSKLPSTSLRGDESIAKTPGPCLVLSLHSYLPDGALSVTEVCWHLSSTSTPNWEGRCIRKKNLLSSPTVHQNRDRRAALCTLPRHPGEALWSAGRPPKWHPGNPTCFPFRWPRPAPVQREPERPGVGHRPKVPPRSREACRKDLITKSRETATRNRVISVPVVYTE